LQQMSIKRKWNYCQLCGLQPHEDLLKQWTILFYNKQETSNINEDVDTYLYHLSNVEIKLIESPLEWWEEN
jgi:hypothetical protein